jgi:hypothetical protein
VSGAEEEAVMRHYLFSFSSSSSSSTSKWQWSDERFQC